ncbi:MAG TPA: hypothetical protein VF637_16155, partial [Sphingomicrobium sp.]
HRPTDLLVKDPLDDLRLDESHLYCRLGERKIDRLLPLLHLLDLISVEDARFLQEQTDRLLRNNAAALVA